MWIEAIINGEVLSREEVPDGYLAPVASLKWGESVEIREQIVTLYLQELQKKMARIFAEGHHIVSYRLIFQSKMTENEESSESDI